MTEITREFYSYNGVWEPATRQFYSYNGEWVPYSDVPPVPPIPESDRFTFMDPTLTTHVTDSLLPPAGALISTALWDGSDLSIVWNGFGTNVHPLLGMWVVSLRVADTYPYPHPMTGVDAPDQYAGIGAWVNASVSAAGSLDVAASCLVVWYPPGGAIDYSLTGGWLVDKKGVYPQAIWYDWVTWLGASTPPASAPLSVGSWEIFMYTYGTTVGQGTMRITPTTEASWSDAAVVATATQSEDEVFNRRVMIETTMAVMAVRQGGGEPTRESIIPYLETVTIEQVEEVFGPL